MKLEPVLTDKKAKCSPIDSSFLLQRKYENKPGRFTNKNLFSFSHCSLHLSDCRRHDEPPQRFGGQRHRRHQAGGRDSLVQGEAKKSCLCIKRGKFLKLEFNFLNIVFLFEIADKNQLYELRLK